MVFKPSFRIKDLTDVVCGSVMLISATVVIKKIRDGSKNTFAYVLMSLTVLIGSAYVGYAIDDAFRYEFRLPNTDKPVYFANEYALIGLVYLIYVSYL